VSLFVPALDLPVWGARADPEENLAGKEHLAAIAAVLVLCAWSAMRQRRPRARSGAASGAPPIHS
jgi:hypothetical protein